VAADRPADATEDQVTSGGEPQEGAACLVLALQAERPLAAAELQLLPAGGELVIGRVRTGPAGDPAEPNNLALPDRFVSAPHASIREVHGRWILQDEGSRNGLFVDGTEALSAPLSDGAKIELGRSFLVFRETAPAFAPPEGLATCHAGYAAQLNALAAIAPREVTVVLRGESGTGKEVLAQAIHRLSKREGAFTAINCAALAQSVAESELFGFKKGAFSGASEDRPGLIRSARGGTLFLDEIGDLPLPMQGLFLRVLQEREVMPVGATKPVPVDFRLIVATHRDLEAMAAAGAFRADLLARIQGFTLRLPPLRERIEDLGGLIAALVRKHAGERAEKLRFSLAAARALFYYSWPLNVRELDRALSVAVALGEGDRIDVSHLPPALGEAPGRAPPSAPALAEEDRARREELIALLRQQQGNIAAVARMMGTERMQVYRWMRRYQILPADFR
jgi:transcriptional regulator of acetoin/glycerol metabolism